jgi:proteic killer suppression protein
MIESFKHKGLRLLFEADNPKGVNPEHVRKIRQILGVLHAAQTIDALKLPTFGLHPLKGNLKGFLGDRTAGLLTLTSWITIEGGEKHGDEEPTPPRRAGRRQSHRAWRVD